MSGYKMPLTMPNYYIDYNPSRKLHGFGFDVRLSKDFPAFARGMGINKKGLESHARNMYEVFGFRQELAETYGGACHWAEGGLLHHIIVPGNASSLVFSEQGLDTPRFDSHNIGTPNQMGICLAVITRYLRIVRFAFETKNGSLSE